MTSTNFDYTTIWKEIIPGFVYDGIARKILQVLPMNSGTHLEVGIISPTKACYVPAHGETPIVISSSKVTVSPFKISEKAQFSDEAVEDCQIPKIKQETLKAIDGIYMQEDYDVIRTFLVGAGDEIIFYGDFSGDFPQPMLGEDIISAIKLLESRFLKPTHILVSPDIAEEMRRRKELEEKLIAFAIEVIVTPHLPSTCIIVLDAKAAGLLIVREEINYIEYTRPQSGLLGVTIYERVSPIITNSEAIVRICNASATPEFL